MTEKETPLTGVHELLGARMGAFAGYRMPFFYLEGSLKEHQWVRTKAGLFDVSHMGQVYIQGRGAAEYLERLTPSSFRSKAPGRATYTVLTNEEGGIVDDLIVARLDERTFYAVINAGRKIKDIDWLKYHLPEGVSVTNLDSRALIALQGPAAERALIDALGYDVTDLSYMRLVEFGDIFVSRTGYTGEDGFELSIPEEKAEEIWYQLMLHDDVKPAGLVARDTLRLEMGYPLYGHDIDDVTSPVEAGLAWIVSRGNTGFIGAGRVLRELEEGAVRQRVGVRLLGKGVAREGCALLDKQGMRVGTLTSGGFSPELKSSIGMGYVDPQAAKPGTKVFVDIRGAGVEAVVVELPFVRSRTKPPQKAA
ncbi:MAG: glycine cleavage system aminomethyltransferase GcvT [Alphaproteobacteria bacterium]|nr:glycine cleavage system aminomethyltransferase GcvT [Alphaproteobacteria bacterium]